MKIFKGSEVGATKRPSPYHRMLRVDSQLEVMLDCYDLIELVGGMSARAQHAFKKVAFAGARGHKDQVKDLEEAIWSLKTEVERIKFERTLDHESE